LPPKTEYSLTDFGRTLSPIIEAMQQWGNTHLNIAGSEESEPLLEQGTSEPQQRVKLNMHIF
jgi:DNA-binding HxlR family transcriptional regulator